MFTSHQELSCFEVEVALRAPRLSCDFKLGKIGLLSYGRAPRALINTIVNT